MDATLDQMPADASHIQAPRRQSGQAGPDCRADRRTQGGRSWIIDMIKLIHLTKTYKELRAVDDLNLEVREGTLFGFLGPKRGGKKPRLSK